jgi:hypothetical protein
MIEEILLSLAMLWMFFMGWLIGAKPTWFYPTPPPLSSKELAERAEANGLDLWRIAQQMRAAALEEQRTSRRDQLQLWARQCERAATDHLACINAISLDSLAATGLKQPVHLGEFGHTRERRRNPERQSVASILLRGGRRG